MTIPKMPKFDTVGKFSNYGNGVVDFETCTDPAIGKRIIESISLFKSINYSHIESNTLLIFSIDSFGLAD